MGEGARIAWGIVAASVLLAVIYVGYREFDRARDIREANQMFAEMAQWPAQFEADRRAQAAQSDRRRQTQHMADVRSRTLAPDMRCVGGVVIRVSGSSYTQLGTVAHPVRCSGRLADQALR